MEIHRQVKTITYNYVLAKWLDTKLKLLSLNQHTITVIFDFVNEVQDLIISAGSILVSYDVSSLFTNVPLNETIEIFAEKVFKDNWFNSTYDLNISKEDLVDLLISKFPRQHYMTVAFCLIFCSIIPSFYFGMHNSSVHIEH